MEAAAADRIQALLERLGHRDVGSTLQVAPTTQLILAKLRDSPIGADDVARLSQVFLQDRRRCMRGVLGPQAYAMPDVDFVFFPVVEGFASTFIDRTQDRTTVLLSLGLIETLRLGCAAGQLASAVDRLERDVDLARELGADRQRTMVRQLRLMTQYFNACAVMHFKHPSRLPGAASLLDDVTRHRVDVTLEAVLMFILLHELGHVAFHRDPVLAASTMSQGAHLVWEFAVPETPNAAKEEEFFADAHALRCVPAAFALPLVHAATFFLHLHNYVESTAPAGPTDHPVAVNRIAALYALATGCAEADDLGHRAVSQAIAAGTAFWQRPEQGGGLLVLRRWVERLARVDWRPAQEALQLLSRRGDVPSDAGLVPAAVAKR